MPGGAGGGTSAVASGGGDFPESVNAALDDAVHRLAWAGDESGRLAILVADAPPHYYPDEQYTYKQAIRDFASRGIKLVPVGASGIDKSTEYLFRQMAAFTGGRYVFLTDHSGVGNPHLTPDIESYEVERLDRILVRVIGDEARAFARSVSMEFRRSRAAVSAALSPLDAAARTSPSALCISRPISWTRLSWARCLACAAAVSADRLPSSAARPTTHHDAMNNRYCAVCAAAIVIRRRVAPARAA
jgi:hypothetical protein